MRLNRPLHQAVEVEVAQEDAAKVELLQRQERVVEVEVLDHQAGLLRSTPKRLLFQRPELSRLKAELVGPVATGRTLRLAHLIRLQVVEVEVVGAEVEMVAQCFSFTHRLQTTVLSPLREGREGREVQAGQRPTTQPARFGWPQTGRMVQQVRLVRPGLPFSLKSKYETCHQKN
jgi:hypothetical protein